MIYINKSNTLVNQIDHFCDVVSKKIKSLKKNLKESNLEIIEYKRDNQELSSIFNKYTDVIKFKLVVFSIYHLFIFYHKICILRAYKEINYFKFLSNSKNKSNLVSIESPDWLKKKIIS